MICIQSMSKKLLLVLFGTVLLMLAPNNDITHAMKQNKDNITISPTPQHLEVTGKGFPITPVVGLVAGEDTDEAAIREVEQALKDIDVKRIIRSTPGEPTPNTPVTIWIGTPSDNPDITGILNELGVDGPQALKKEGYVLATSNNGAKQIVLAGKDNAGTFYAAKTFEQIILERPGRSWIPSVSIRDWPEMPLRGTIEGFYGQPWSHEDRLSQIEFYGQNKMNTYVYAPKDDPYHLTKWREPYPEDRFNQLEELVQKSKQNHVQFVFALSPGSSVCYSGNEDFTLLMDKMQSMYDIGVRSYAIFYDDISGELQCEEDRERFGDEESPAAAAQAYLLNRFQEEFIETHEDTERLITVPTEYSGLNETAYKQHFGDLVNPNVIVDWTGPAVVSPEITGEQAQKAADIFNHDLLLWDNYPVNDFMTSRLFLGPLENRDRDLNEHGVQGITANPMIQAEASKIALYTVADYTWNPADYNPEASWERSLKAFGGDAASTLKLFSENSYASNLNGNKGALILSTLIDDFWEAYETDNPRDAANQLLEEFKKFEDTPTLLQENLDNKNFLDETSAWLKKLEIHGKSGQEAVKMMMALQNNDQETADQHRANLDEILANDTINLKLDEPRVATKALDGVNRFRGAAELILYTPEYGETTRTNIYGYEITVVDDTVVKMGGNNSPIPDDGYVLSLHVSNWLEDNAIIGAKVKIENDEVTLTIPEGEYTIPNTKVMAPGVMQPFLEKAITIHAASSQ
ncbi:beta-N-acetylglucosaminidase domain-containing protein [Oceanobacillus luteolus]|nr:beta-N-acetylglucosaminidase domain-containing protein [Oceanobacillus luteolus]MCM3741261.1 beta-N-acetylglucosaminidase domain-containing protein [Oceanobacillus luteolus]